MIRPLAWELPHAAYAALKSKKKKKIFHRYDLIWTCQQELVHITHYAGEETQSLSNEVIHPQSHTGELQGDLCNLAT